MVDKNTGFTVLALLLFVTALASLWASQAKTQTNLQAVKNELSQNQSALVTFPVLDVPLSALLLGFGFCCGFLAASWRLEISEKAKTGRDRRG